MRTISQREFTNEIRTERGKGFGFVPLIGAGLSASSGVPISTEISDYLKRIICICLQVDRPDRVVRWTPRGSEWPSAADSHNHSLDWNSRLILALEEAVRSNPRSNDTKLIQEAIGAAADWRTSLQFISRFTQSVDDHPWLGPPEQMVIDRLFLHVLKGFRPNLGHRMVALLSDLLRFEVALTTNFDDLLERAFTSLGKRIA